MFSPARRPVCRLLVGLLTLCWLSEVSAADPIARVAIDSRRVDPRAFNRTDLLMLQQKLVLRLAQEGFAVVARDRSPGVIIRFEVEARAVVVVAEAAGQQRRVVVKQADENLDAIHLEANHRIIEMVRELASILGREQQPIPSADPRPPVEELAQQEEPTRLMVEAGLGWEWRGQNDLSSELRLALRRRLPGRIWLVAGVALSGWKNRHTTVLDSKTTLGASWRVGQDGRSFSIVIDVLGGVLHHMFRFEAAGERVQGYRADLMVASRLSANWLVSESGWLATAWVEPTWTGRERQFQQGERVVWHAEPFRIAGGLALAIEF